MNKIKLAVLYFTIIIASMIGIIIHAEHNYQNAINAAKASEGTDQAIEDAMMLYGFDVEALDPTEPTVFEKIFALSN